jgi:hypothetical protein
MDTALLYRHPKGPHMKPSLKNLSRIYLSEIIQESSHDSIIDSVSAMKLAKLKLIKGLDFGFSDIDSSKIVLFDLLSQAKKLTGIFDDTYSIKKASYFFLHQINFFNSWIPQMYLHSLAKVIKRS